MEIPLTARRLSFLLLLALPLALMACGDDSHEEPEHDDATAEPAFPQSFESETGLTVLYPEDWRVRETEQGVMLANDDLVMSTLLDDDAAELPAGGVALTILTPLTEASYPGLVELAPPALVEEIAVTLADALGGAVELGEVEETTVGDHPAARVGVARPDRLSEGYLIGFKPQSDQAILALVQAREGALADVEATLSTILQNVRYEPPQAAGPTPTQPSVVAPPTTTPEGATAPPAATPTAEGGS
jgi:hypothetical protein